jgi:hypothetical protein
MEKVFQLQENFFQKIPSGTIRLEPSPAHRVARTQKSASGNDALCVGTLGA